MIGNYFKTALRNFSRNMMFSLINLAGLAVGLTASILIMLYVFNELNFDTFHEKSDRIYRMFSFDLIRGNPEHALKEPFSIVLTADEAHKIFKDEDPLGKLIQYNNQYTLKVTGIIEPIPANSHLQFNALISFSTLYEFDNVYLDWDGGHGYLTYVEFIPAFDPSSLEKRLEAFMQKHINYKYNQVGANLVMMFEPLKDVHLFSSAMADLATKGNLKNIYIFSAIALFILLIACINFMNLATARSSKRAREVGVRKVIGATEGKLRRQFLAESTLLSLFAMILALIMVELVQPVFNDLVGRELSLYDAANTFLLAGIFVLIILVGLVSGSYPAFYLASFKPVRVLKGGFVSSRGKTLFRDILVVFQFAITIGLIVCTIVNTSGKLKVFGNPCCLPKHFPFIFSIACSIAIMTRKKDLGNCLFISPC
ncbi:MAG: FtsX-like permease family protein [Bacteroidota bacterium]|nr:FtsX-like permease family protein [Bacteroidota bacterium]